MGWVKGCLAALGLITAGATPLPPLGSWAAFYGASAPLAALAAPDLLVLEPDHPWSPGKMRRPGQLLLAYLSVGEVHASRPYFKGLEAAQAFAGRNPDWPDAWRVDPASPAWQTQMLDEIVPTLAERGYDGLFLDTLDAAGALEDSRVRPHARAEMSQLVLALHERFPKLLLVANGGIDLLGTIAPALSGLVTESVQTDYDFKAKRYLMRAPAEAASRAARLADVKRTHGLSILVLEYVEPTDAKTRAAVAARDRELGFVPYVSDIGLTALTPPP